MKIRGSGQLRELFKKQCQVSQIKERELTRDVSTRWNSTFYMLKRAFQMKIVSNFFLIDKQVNKSVLVYIPAVREYHKKRQKIEAIFVNRS